MIFHIHIRPHPLFTVSPSPSHAADLIIPLTITLSESLLGFDRIMFTHLDGRGVRLVSPRGQRVVRHGDELYVAGEGMPKRDTGGGGWFGMGKDKNKGERGNLRVKFGVEMPDASWALRAEVSHRQQDERSNLRGQIKMQNNEKLIRKGTTVKLPPAPGNIYPVPPLIDTRYLVDRI